jgi:hypothetical protein
MNISSKSTNEAVVATVNHNAANHNTVPADIDMSVNVPVTQSQTYDCTTTNTTNRYNTFPSTSSYSTPSNTNTSSQVIKNVPHVPNFTRVYHDNNINYVMDEYCLPIADSFKCGLDTCKFGRECLVAKQSVLLKGTLLQTTSSTLFTSVPPTSKKNRYTLHDTRLLRCFNQSCRKSKFDSSPKEFHYVCFMHMLKHYNPDNKMKMISITSVYDDILDFVGDHVNISCLKEFSTNQLSNLTFPFCGQRCCKTITNYKNKKKNKNNGDSEYAILQSWDNDGSSRNKSSTEVLIEWLTTEENCTNYFGGVNEKGATNGNRKESYHYHIRDLIKSENGEFKTHNMLKLF